VATKKIDLTKVSYADGELAYDADMPMGAMRKLFGAANTGDLLEMFEAYSKIIYSWPYEGDPKNVDAWDALKRTEFARLNEAVMGSLADLGEA
jgi:hypothetical protein